MPITTTDELERDPGSFLLEGPKTQTPDPSFLDISAASFRQESDVGSFAEWIKTGGDKHSEVIDPNFELTDELIDAYPGDPNDLVEVYNKQRYNILRDRVRQELNDRQVREEGGWMATGMDIVAALSSPTSLIPGGVVVQGARGGWTIGRTAMATAASTGLMATAQESVLASTQQLRDGRDVAVAATGGVVVGALLGTGVGLIARNRLNKLIDEVDDQLIPDNPDIVTNYVTPDFATARSIGAREATTLEQESLVGSTVLGRGEATGSLLSRLDPRGRLTPVARAASSASKTVRTTMQRLVDDPLLRIKNLEGTASEIPVEIAIRVREAALEVPTRLQRDEYKKWLARTKRENAALPPQDRVPQRDMRYETFMEHVGRAMRRGDVDNFSPEVSRVARAYRKHVFDPLKNDAIAVGLFSEEDAVVQTAESYLTRSWNVERLLNQRADFYQRIRNWMKQGDETLDEQELEQIIDELYIGMTTAPNAMHPFFDDLALGTASPLKKRVLMIPDEQIEDFLDSRIDNVARRYLRSMSAEVEFKKAGFSNKQLTDEIEQINADYESRIARAKSPAEEKQLGRQWAQDIRDLQAMTAALFDKYKKPQDPYGMASRSIRALKQWNFLTMLGQMTLSAAPDAARIITEQGLARSAKPLRALFSSSGRAFRRMQKEEVRKAGTALDLVLANGRMEVMADIRDPFSQLSGFERFQQGASQFFGKATGMTYWNSALKQFAGSLTADRVLTDSARLLGEGKALTKNERAVLANMFVDEAMARRIGAQFRKHGEEFNGLKTPNTDAWDDLEALRTFRAAVTKHTDLTINTPGIGQSPLWTKSEIGSLIGQFKSFAFASHQQTLMRGLQKHDADFLYGTLGATAIAGVVLQAKQLVAGKNEDGSDRVKLPEITDPEYALKALDQSGYFAFFGEINNIADKQFNMSIDRLVGGSQTRPYNAYGKVLPLLGPGASRAEDVLQMGNNLIGLTQGREWKASDTKRLRRMLWFQNHWALRNGLGIEVPGVGEVSFNRLEQELNEAVGVE